MYAFTYSTMSYLFMSEAIIKPIISNHSYNTAVRHSAVLQVCRNLINDWE